MNMIKTLTAAALLSSSAVANAWWGGPFDGFGNGDGNFSFNMNTSARGQGYGAPYYGPYGYAPAYGYAPYYGAPYGGYAPTQMSEEQIEAQKKAAAEAQKQWEEQRQAAIEAQKQFHEQRRAAVESRMQWHRDRMEQMKKLQDERVAMYGAPVENK